jgi:hypothetical protein
MNSNLNGFFNVLEIAREKKSKKLFLQVQAAFMEIKKNFQSKRVITVVSRFSFMQQQKNVTK